MDVEWDAAFVLSHECGSASDEMRRAMAAITVSSGESTRHMMIHHHADSRLSYPALAAAMGRLLTKPINCTARNAIGPMST